MRQYIGARYVPKFMGTYDATQIYEALCVVDNGLGTSYISKVPTPAGTPLTDTDYWAIYGASSGAIISLQDQIDDMKDGTVAGSLQNQINTMNDGTVSGSLQNQIDDNTAAISALTSTKSNIILMGDSWSDYDHDSSNVRIPQILGQHFGCTVHNYSYGGTGFDVTNGYDEQITWFAADNIANDTIKCVILVCGLNDYQRSPQVTYSAFLAMLEDWYDKLIAVIGTNIPVYWFHNYSIENDLTLPNATTFATQWTYYHNIQEECSKPVIMPDTFAWVSSWNNDTHPDPDGSTDFAMNMCRAIEGIAPNIFMYDSVKFTINSHDGYMKYYYKGDIYLDCFFEAELADLVTITAITSLSYQHTPPARLVAGYYLGEGHSIAANDYVGITMVVNNPTFITNTTYTTYGKTYAKIPMA